MLTSRKKKLLAMYLILRQRKKSRRREFWVDPLLQDRHIAGSFKVLFTLWKSEKSFFAYFRMSIRSFDELYEKLKDKLKKQETNMRNSIQPKEMLAVTIRYLATGNTFSDLHFYYKLGISTISKIVDKVCSSLWDVLRSECFPELTAEKLKEISEGFFKKTQFPHCVGAVDGKHIRVIKPEHSGSLYFNYKGYFSIVLMAVCDANYCFTFVDIGAYGSEADPSVFQKSNLWKKIQDQAMEFPKNEPLPGSESPNMPYFFLGDEAFAFSTKLMRPFGGHNLTVEKRIFNYRLSRARRLIECTFGIMSNKWRIFHRPLNVNIDLAVKITKACVILHNFVRVRDGYSSEDASTVVGWDDLSVGPRTNQGTNQSLRGGIKAIQVRNVLAKYFMTDEGSVSWQLKKI